METSASILVVDDQENVLDYLLRTLEIAGYQVLAARDGIQALALLESEPVDLILADIAMPRMNGYQLHGRVIENPQWVAIPFIFLTARSLDSDIWYGKELGVDDYLTKPVRHEELLAAVRGRLRRARQLSVSPVLPASRPTVRSEVLSFGQLRIDLGQHRVWIDGRQVKLSAREFALLAHLARRENRVVPLQELVRVTHGLEADRTEAGSLLRPLIRSIRRKLGYRAGQMGCIESVRGVGYQLVVPPDQECRDSAALLPGHVGSRRCVR